MNAIPTKNNHVTELIECGREFYRRGWVMGTSGNFSALIDREPMRVCITASGNHKGKLNETNFIEIDGYSNVVKGDGKPSAETSVHLAIYELLPAVRSILHTHSVWGTLLSDQYYERGAIEIEGYEMLKGLAGVKTHEHKERVPIIDNTQDYDLLGQQIDEVIRNNKDIHGVYLRRHGLYTWGESIAEADRHIEIFEFLFEVLGRSQNHLR